MAATLDKKFVDMIQKKSFAFVATLMPDGTPQVTPVWVDSDGQYVILNTAKGRIKDRNMRRDPRVTVALSDPENPYQYVEIRGRVAEITEKGADEHIDKMAKKYLDKDKYPFRTPDEVRVIFKIAPEHSGGNAA